MNSQILCKITEKTASAEEFAEENHKVMPSPQSLYPPAAPAQSNFVHLLHQTKSLIAQSI